MTQLVTAGPISGLEFFDLVKQFGLFGSGVKGATTFNLNRDIYAFSRGQGLFFGAEAQGHGVVQKVGHQRDGPDRDGCVREIGATTGRLIDATEGVDAFTGIPAERANISDGLDDSWPAPARPDATEATPSTPGPPGVISSSRPSSA